jgi:hypothetical protein
LYSDCANLGGSRVATSQSCIARWWAAPSTSPKSWLSLSGSRVDVILTCASAVFRVQETTVIPVVALSANPVGSGLAASLARPGANEVTPLVVRWIDWLGRNYADVTDTIRELIRRQIRIETIINRITFDGTTTDPMQQAVRDALIRMDGNVVRPSERMRPIR